MKFNCSGCGACCRRVGTYPEFTEPVNPDGSCSHLTTENQCSIYDKRPLICRVEEFYERHREELKMGKLEFYELNYTFCNQFIKEDNLDSKFIINF